MTAALDRTFLSLRVPNYRRYFAGQVISLSGNWMQTVAEMWLVLKLTGSGTAVLARDDVDGRRGDAETVPALVERAIAATPDATALLWGDEQMKGRSFAEATHIYDPRNGLRAAWGVLFEQWRLAFEIGAANIRRGAAPTPPLALLAMILHTFRGKDHEVRQPVEVHAGVRL